MYKDLFTVFGYTVQTHAVISIIAIIIGYGVALGLTRKTIYYKHIQDFIFYAIIGAIIGARLWHVFVFQWPYYSQHPLDIIAIWQGGISIEGAIAGGIIALIVYTYKHKLNFWEMADYLAPAMMLGQAIGRVACFFAGDAFGRPTHANFGVVFPKGTVAYSYYGSQPLWPAISWEIQGDTVIFSILLIIFLLARKRLPKGMIFVFYVFMYDAERFMLEFFRGDSPRYSGLTGGQWSAIVLTVISIILMIYLYVRRRGSNQNKQQKAAE
ncbi:phosphatidylglycerol:prolipoprotein diacylglycerol transferase [Scopulibacillus daqui]|uniref:Phosphatidylglycerol--prolipoprotein diacylglyceryl transferase n=1 Tax=Scopulibacillus daqui TaxID=1469162 RepID=A0ABS2Q2D3_9BACL|nr:prolipoprotein diacylglyceryl transferase [Scopulibacillus daqui]MBM7646281.1 phosphatidylglycerol:prolipoprotein diacylglycerol transferase [Scopulibacillus daqui]